MLRLVPHRSLIATTGSHELQRRSFERRHGSLTLKKISGGRKVLRMEESKIPLLAPHSSESDGEYTEVRILAPDPVCTEKHRNPSNEYANGFHTDICISVPEDHVPLSSNQSNDGFETPNHGDGDGEITQMQKALEPFSNIPLLGKPSSIDPFMNKTPTIQGFYEWTKTIVLLPLLVVRVLLIGIVMFVGLVATKTALAGWQKRQAALPQWRRTLMGVTRLCGRCFLYCCGFYWIRRIGRPAPKEVAPIVVSNHVSFIDPIFYFYELFPSIVSSKSHDSIPLAGTIIRSMQVIPVDRLSSDSRKNATIEIERRAASPEFPPVLLFPEGTTTNGRALISFKLGAFVPGFPVQPVVVRYPFVHFDISWGDISLANLLFRMLTQFNNFMEVEYLPVIYPSAREQGSPAEFAERVRYEMAQALCAPETEHTYGDLMLSVKAQQLKMSSPASFMVEMGRVEKLLRLKAGEVKEYLEKFAAMDPTLSGTVSMDQFLEWHHMPRCWISEEIFHLFDKAGQGFINFREFVAVSGSIVKDIAFESRMRSAFDACNLQSDGCILPAELERCLRLSMPLISSTKVEQWFKNLDLDGDGVISWKEFQTFMEVNPELLGIFMVGTVGTSPLP